MEISLIFIILTLLMILPVFTVLLMVLLWFRISKTAKNYSKIPSYGAANPLLVFWQYSQQSQNSRSEQIPFIANLLRVCSANAYMFQREGIFLLWNGLSPYAVIYKAEYIKEVINSRVADDKSKDYIAIQSMLGTGLLTSKGRKWRNRRKLIQPCVHMRNVENFIPIFNEHSLVLVDKLKEKINEPWVDAEDVLVACTVDIIFHTAMGVHLGAQKRFHEISQDLLEPAKEVTEFMAYRISKPWLWYDTIFYHTSFGRRFQRAENTIRNTFKRVIHEGKEILETKRRNTKCGQQSESRSKIFLEILLEQYAKNENFTYNDIEDEALTFIFGGYDTSSTALIWVLCLLGLHSEIQDKVFQELYSVFGDDKTREVTIEDVRSLVYLEQVIKETLRLYPPVPLIGRENKESIKVGKYVIPQGNHTIILINMLHKNPEVFPNPEKFDPERFSPENSSERDAFCYLPFSCGVRACIGSIYAMMEMKIILAHVLRNFKVTTLDPLEKASMMMTVTLRCLNTPRLRFSYRT